VTHAEALVYAVAFAQRYDENFCAYGAIDAATRATHWAAECVDAIRGATAVHDDAATTLVEFRAFGQDEAARKAEGK
jgi:hypothetical protein